MMRTAADEEAAPKYTHVERERRFLVDPARLPPLPATYVLIVDRYITDTRLRLRRMTDSVTGQVALKLAKKYESTDPTARRMVNAYVTEAEYAVFAALPAQPVQKRRYALDGFGIDVFEGKLAGLILAEIEAPDAETLAAIDSPSWALREVTHDPGYQGGALGALDRAPSLKA